MRYCPSACLCLSTVLLVACGDDRGTDDTTGESASGSDGATSNSTTAGPGTSDTAGSATSTSGTTSPSSSAEVGTSGPQTDSANPSQTGGPTSAAESTTDSPTTDAPTTAGSGGGEAGGGVIDVTLSGCDVDLGGTVVVSYNGSLGVASVYDSSTLTGSFQFDLSGTGTLALSTQHRVNTGAVVNMVDIGQGTWTNLDSDSLGGGVDRIGGTLTVSAWDPASGVSDIAFTGVSLLNVVNGNVCTIDGTIVTDELYP